MYTINGRDWFYVDKEKIFAGNIDKSAQITNYFSSPVQARAIKFLPLTW
jgi:hypothetical protein